MARLFLIALLGLGMALASTPSTAEAGLFNRRSSNNSSGYSRGYAIRGAGPLTIRVSRGTYNRLNTFYPTLIRRQ